MKTKKLKKPEKVKQLERADYNGKIYFWAVTESGRTYLGVSEIKTPEIIEWQLINNPFY